MRKIIQVILVLIIVSAIIYGLIMVFTHPDKTQTRLFLDYWYIWLAAMVSAGLFVLTLRD